MSARRQKTSEEGQDMRNPWHQTQLRGRTKHMLCVQFILKCTKCNTGGGSRRNTRGAFDAVGLLITLS